MDSNYSRTWHRVTGERAENMHLVFTLKPVLTVQRTNIIVLTILYELLPWFSYTLRLPFRRGSAVSSTSAPCLYLELPCDFFCFFLRDLLLAKGSIRSTNVPEDDIFVTTRDLEAADFYVQLLTQLCSLFSWATLNRIHFSFNTLTFTWQIFWSLACKNIWWFAPKIVESAYNCQILLHSRFISLTDFSNWNRNHD